MKFLSALALVIGIGILVTGVYSFAIGMVEKEDSSVKNYGNNMMSDYNNGMMSDYNNGMMSDYNNGMMGDYNNGMMSDYNNGMMSDYNNGMMNGYGQALREDYVVNKLIPVNLLDEKVELYIADYRKSELVIGEVILFSNSEYHYSIIEKNTNKGAMELLVNPITGSIYQEYGPNMMWNEKYSMMGRNYLNRNNNPLDELSKETSLEKANQYLAKINKGFEAKDNGQAFYGYYTFHVNVDTETVGMLSVNTSTGDVWYHNWHGNVVEVKLTNH